MDVTARPGPAPHLRPGGAGRRRRPAGEDQKSLPGPHLRPPRPVHGQLAGHGGAGRRPGPGASELLRTEGGGGNAPVGDAGQRGSARRRRAGGYVPVGGGAAGRPGIRAIRDLQLRPAGLRLPAQPEVLVSGGVRRLRAGGPLRPGGRALLLLPGSGGLLPGGGDRGEHHRLQRVSHRPGPGH